VVAEVLVVVEELLMVVVVGNVLVDVVETVVVVVAKTVVVVAHVTFRVHRQFVLLESPTKPTLASEVTYPLHDLAHFVSSTIPISSQLSLNINKSFALHLSPEYVRLTMILLFADPFIA
jgi:hypothetical protein